MTATDLPVSLRKILIVTPQYLPRHIGGTELRARKLAHWLKAQGVSVEILCVESVEQGAQDGVTRACDTYEGIVVHRLHLTHTDSLHAFRERYDHSGIAAYLEELVARQPPDLIHLISGYNVTACAIRVGYEHRIPTVVTLTDYWFTCPRMNLIRSTGAMCSGPHSALDCTRCLLGEKRRYRLPEQYLPGIMNIAWHTVAQFDAISTRIPLYQEVRSRQQCLVDLLNRADAVTIPTNSLRTPLVRAGVKDRFYLSRHSIVPEELGIQSNNPKIESAYFRFGYLGQISQAKGVDLLAIAYTRLAAAYEDISLTIWGKKNGPSRYISLLAVCRREPTMGSFWEY